MHDNMNHPEHPDHLDDPLVRDTADRLDALGAYERGEPDDGFERRLASATRPGVLASVQPERASRMWTSWWAVPIAACLLFGVIGLWLVRSASTTTPQPGVQLVWNEDDIDDFLFIDGLTGERPVLDGSSDTGMDEEQPADELLFDLFGLEGGAS